MQQFWQLLTRSWPLIAFGFLTIFWGSLGQSFFVSVFGNHIQKSLDLSATTYGTLYSAATVSSGIMMMLYGSLIDHWPLKRFVLSVAIGLITATVVMGFADGMLSLFFGFFLLRLFGQGMFPHTAQTTMARYFEGDRGKALSLSSSGMPFGEVALPLVTVGLIAVVGWRVSWWIMGLSIVICYLPLAYWALRKSGNDFSLAPKHQKNEHDIKGVGRKAMLRDYRFWMALPAVLATPFILTGVFIQMGFIIEQKQWDPVWVASCFVLLGIGHWVFGLLAGVLVDRFSAVRLFPFSPVPLIAAMASLVFFSGNALTPVFMGLLGMSLGLGAPVFSALWAEVYGTKNLGAIRSLLTGTMMLSTSISPILFGVLIDNGISLEALFSVLAIGTACAVISAAMSYPRTIKS